MTTGQYLGLLAMACFLAWKPERDSLGALVIVLGLSAVVAAVVETIW